jgi:hypothetical protein
VVTDPGVKRTDSFLKSKARSSLVLGSPSVRNGYAWTLILLGSSSNVSQKTLLASVGLG